MKCLYCDCTESKVIDSRFGGRQDDSPPQGVRGLRQKVYYLRDD